MMVHLVVPEEGLPYPLVKLIISIEENECSAYLVPIPPEEVLGANVHVGVLDALLHRRLVALVLPMLVPESPGVDTGEDERRHRDVDCELAPEVWWEKGGQWLFRGRVCL